MPLGRVAHTRAEEPVGLARATSASEGAARSTVKRIKREAVQEQDYMGKPSVKQKDKRVQVSGI